DGHVTGVQTCALPIFRSPTTNEYKRSFITPSSIQAARGSPSFMIEIVELTPESAERLNDLVEQLRIKKIKRHIFLCADQTKPKRSEERRVGKECKSEW